MLMVALATPAPANSKPSRTVVVVVGPPSAPPPADGLGYSVTVAGSTYETAVGVLDALKEARGGAVAVLVHEQVPVSSLPVLSSLVSKASRSSEVRFFVFDDARTQMARIPVFDWVRFSLDPDVVGGL